MDIKIEDPASYQEDVNACFLRACEQGDLELVKYLGTSPELKCRGQVGRVNCLVAACQNGHAHVVDYLLNSPEIQKDFNQYEDMLRQVDEAFMVSCQIGNLALVAQTMKWLNPYVSKGLSEGLIVAAQACHKEVVEYIIKTDDNKTTWLVLNVFEQCCKEGNMTMIKHMLEGNPPVYRLWSDKGNGLAVACATGQMEVVQYLTEPQRFTPHAEYTGAVINASGVGNVEIVHYLLNCEHLKPYIHVHSCNDAILLNAFRAQHMDVVKYLVYDFKLPLTRDIVIFYDSDQEERGELKEMFQRRELQSHLQETLPEDSKAPARKAKI